MLVFDGIAKAERHWRELEASGCCFVFQTYDWLVSWQHTVGEAAGIQPCIVWVGTEAGDGLMLLPLGIERVRGCRVLVWLGAPLADYRCPILAPEGADILNSFGQTLWPMILAQLPSIDYLHMTVQPASIGEQANPFLQLPHRTLPYGTHATALEGDWQSFYSAKRSSKSRNTERRKAKKLMALGQLSFKIATSPASCEPMLEALFAQKSMRFAAQGVADPLAMPGVQAFVRDLTRTKVGEGQIQLAALQLDDRIIAVHWGAVYRGRFYFLLPALDVGETARHSPGGLLINNLLEWAFSEGLTLFDFTIGDEPYKTHWCEQQEPLCETLIAINIRGRIAVAALRSDALIRHEIRSRPWLYDLAANLRRWLPKHH